MRILLWNFYKRMTFDQGNTFLALMIFLSLVLSSYQRADSDDPYFTSNKKEPDAPVFRFTDTNITVGPGERATLKCRVDNLGTKKITWRKSGEKHPLTIGLFTFVPDERISVDLNQRTNEWSLIIKDVKPEDEGIYVCTISTKNEGDNTYEVKLTVKSRFGTEAVQVNARGTPFIEKGKTIHLECNASGKPEPPRDVEWYKDGKLIESDSLKGIFIEKKIESKVLYSYLVIKNSQLSDAGYYTCMSSNKDVEVIQVHILDVEIRNDNVKRGSGGLNPDAQIHSENGASSFMQQSNTLLLLKYTFVVLTTTVLVWAGR